MADWSRWLSSAPPLTAATHPSLPAHPQPDNWAEQPLLNPLTGNFCMPRCEVRPAALSGTAQWAWLGSRGTGTAPRPAGSAAGPLPPHLPSCPLHHLHHSTYTHSPTPAGALVRVQV